ncbi:helix-turn-helix domain-containing protein [Halovivax limisalsi]|uniref:helix-turn-helix domain-containing protein n=1 Tax=Halovivax limisalsi TaxID=1453760 RepID=UPI001FFDDD59|nr:helix-turn-helix domain-containing protein [Halovivax limisalsi]
MAKIEAISADELLAALESAEGKRETMRLMVAILYKRGPSVPMIAEWFDMRERTIYDWLDRLEARPIAEAITDDERPGRPPKLAADERERFERAVRQAPTECGYDADRWSTELAGRFLREELDVEYSRRHVQRLLREAGLEPRRPPANKETVDARAQFWDAAAE